VEKLQITEAENVHDGLTPRQTAWEGFGLWKQREIVKSPESFVIKSFPFENESWGLPFLKALGSLEGKTVLDVGCGLGYLSVYAAKARATVIAVDLKSEMLQAAHMIADLNGVECQFYCAKASKLPFRDNSIDVAAGMLILHHLSRPDMLSAFREVHRVLRDGGKAIFVEPVENSRLFNLAQNVLPAGRKDFGYYRPSCLCPKAWARYLADHDGRDITSMELMQLGASFKSVSVKPFGLLDRIDRFIKDRRLVRLIHFTDHRIFKSLPFLERYSRQVVVEYEK
jgi:ubiquinone/menaquinone biosynthesis C-methylase UbiE